MTKYNEQFKQRIVDEYFSGGIGIQSLAARHGVGRTVIRRWVASYREHGNAGLRKKHVCYDAEFKLSVLQRMWRDELSYGQVSALFDIRGAGCVAGWERLYHEGGIDALSPRRRGRPRKMATSLPPKPTETGSPDERTREELLKENEYLRAEVAYPKKARCAAGEEAGSAKEKAQIVRELRQHHPVAALLKAAGLARSTFYYQLGTLNVGDRHADLKARIRAVFDHHKGRYGYRRVTAAIRQTGHLVNHKAVQRLMQQLQLKSLLRPKKYRSWRGEVGKVAPNLLQRQFSATQANQKWVTDVTEFNVGGQKLYLSPVMDLYNGEIVAYQMDRRPSFELVSSMLKKALAKLKRTDRPLLHSDQGWQYRMPAFRRQLKRRKLTQSMSRKGNCLDNAAMESFFGTLKSECYKGHRFTCVEHLRDTLERYIHYYNHERIKLKLKGLSPVQYRTQPLGA
ncbi:MULTISPECIES: IS3 family transposase [Burkholderia]|uniref:IS3 family transposase n=5 Tax=Burkholderia TaxID=32008 RepID=A0ABW7LDU2_9BURK|nr:MULTISPECIES: IS3 family transposase [Burkholderia]MCA8038070.1 IS3 family transposase [Burkholderia arboris]MCA8245526.1 IS3 family transposase [Burkholderia sp. AU32262]PHP88068.1 IS3 family transposase [Burkholderia sp. AU18528]PHP90712.1 IS3 family transposase [Burkholderia sp. AU18528]PHP90787.1 IS3 family transposase [Burkholderia sp. AU18528]